MILVTVTKKQGVEIATPYDLALDPEKIVSTRILDGVTQIDYAETFDRNRQTITYEVTAAKPNIDATITGEYSTHTYLALTVYWAENRDLRPFPAISSTYALDMQEKYIVDIQDVEYTIVWKNTKIATTLRKVRFVPGAFKEEVIYVTNNLIDLVDNTPSETTTTSTAEPATTTTTEIVTTTTEVGTTTTTWDGLCREYTITNLDQQLPAVFTYKPCDQQCDEQFLVVEYGQPQTVCLCEAPVFVTGSEMYSVVMGAVCPTTTTTTELGTTTTSPEPVG